MKEKGISLISLIVTIVVIIILATIVITGSGNSAEEAKLARFVSEFGDFQSAIQEEYLFAYKRYALKGISPSEEQIYYGLATGTEVTVSTVPTETGTVAELEQTIEPSGLKGTKYYEITVDTNIPNWKDNKGYTGPRANEHHYITDEGELFTLPGYTFRDNGETYHYVNGSKYYTD